MDVIEREILERMMNGDPDAFRNIFDRLYIPLVRRASFYLMDIAVAEDIVQEALTNIWHNRRTLKNIGNFDGYLIQMVRNGCLNYIKHTKVNNNYRKKHMLQEVSEIDTDPESYYKAIYDLIANMPERRRQIFEMSVFQQKTYMEISIIIGISVNTVKEHIKAAYAYLRKESAHIPYP